MDNPKDSQPNPQSKTKIFVLTPDRIKQLGISNLLKQFQVPKSSSVQEKEDSSKSSEPNIPAVEASPPSPASSTSTTVTTPKINVDPVFSTKLGLSMKNKLSSILLKEDVKPKIHDVKIIPPGSQNIFNVTVTNTQKELPIVQSIEKSILPQTNTKISRLEPLFSQRQSTENEEHLNMKIEIHEHNLENLAVPTEESKPQIKDTNNFETNVQIEEGLPDQEASNQNELTELPKSDQILPDLHTPNVSEKNLQTPMVSNKFQASDVIQGEPLRSSENIYQTESETILPDLNSLNVLEEPQEKQDQNSSTARVLNNFDASNILQSEPTKSSEEIESESILPDYDTSNIETETSNAQSVQDSKVPVTSNTTVEDVSPKNLVEIPQTETIVPDIHQSVQNKSRNIEKNPQIDPNENQNDTNVAQTELSPLETKIPQTQMRTLTVTVLDVPNSVKPTTNHHTNSQNKVQSTPDASPKTVSIKTEAISPAKNTRLESFKSPLQPKTLEIKNAGVLEVELIGKPLFEGPRIENVRLGSFKKKLSADSTLSKPGPSTEITNAGGLGTKSKNHRSRVTKPKIIEKMPKTAKAEITKLKNILSEKMIENDRNQSEIILEMDTASRKSSRCRKPTFSNEDFVYDSLSKEKGRSSPQIFDDPNNEDDSNFEQSFESSAILPVEPTKVVRVRKKVVKEEFVTSFDEHDEFFDNSEILPDQPKKVGRPRKTVVKEEFLTEDQEMDLDETESQEDFSDHSENQEKLSKMGRPKKPRVIFDSEEDEPLKSTQEILLQNEEDLTPKVKRRPGRPRKTPQPTEYVDVNVQGNKRVRQDSETTPTLTPNRKRRKLNDSDNNLSDSADCDSQPSWKRNYNYKPVEVDRRKGPRDIPKVTEEEFQAAIEYLKETHVGKKSVAKQKLEDEMNLRVYRYFMQKEMVTCGKCEKEMQPGQFKLHNYNVHFNLGWRVGEPEVDMDDEKKVIAILNLYLKQSKNRNKFLKCDKCGCSKKSAVGYLSHINICQKTGEEILAQRVTCQLCNKSYAKSSIKIHLATSHIQSTSTKENSTETGKKDDEEQQQEGENGTGRVKRKAAEKACNLIQEVIKSDPDDSELTRNYRLALYSPEDQKLNRKLMSSILVWVYVKDFAKKEQVKCKFKNCQFFATTIPEMKEHINECRKNYANSYICRYCLYTAETEKDFISHYRYNHNTTNDAKDAEDSDDFEEEEIPDEDIIENERFFDNVLAAEPDEKIRQHKFRSKVLFLTTNRSGPATQNIIYTAAFKWTLQFVTKNHSDLLYPNAFHDENTWKLILDEEEKSKYLPKKKISMNVETVKIAKKFIDNQGTERNWKKFKLFDAETEADSITMYCGGPIWAMAWAPTPYDFISDQILAVSCLKEQNRNFPIDENPASSEIIQFWNLGPVQNRQKFSAVTPKLEFCLAHDHGNVWCMEWCPSGCYNETDGSYVSENKFGRLGLLALACSDGNIPIYTIPKLKEAEPKSTVIVKDDLVIVPDNSKHLPKTEIVENEDVSMLEEYMDETIDDSGTVDDDEMEDLNNTLRKTRHVTLTETDDVKIYKTKPTYMLIISDTVDQNLGLWSYQCMKISWSKYKDHNIIAAGYSNGVVALWNLTSMSPLLRSERDGVTIMKPYHLFRAHEGPVTALCLSPLENGRKWLFTGSHDRTSKFWNLEDTTHPNTVHNKNTSITDGSWLSHWMSTFCSYDDSMYFQNTNATIQGIRNFMCDQVTVFPSNSLMMSISTCDWGNQYAMSNTAGELGILFHHQLLTNTDSKKSDKYKRQLVTISELVDTTLSPEERLQKINEKKSMNVKSEKKGDSLELDKKDFIKVFMKERNSADVEEQTYEEAQSRFGLVFNDLNMNTKEIIPEVSSKLRRSSLLNEAPVMMYPLMSINRVSWNPNKQSYLFIASGYNAGFVRIHCIRHMCNSHVERRAHRAKDFG